MEIERRGLLVCGGDDGRRRYENTENTRSRTSFFLLLLLLLLLRLFNTSRARYINDRVENAATVFRENVNEQRTEYSNKLNNT